MIRPEKAFEYPLLAEKSVSISVKTFFFGDYLFVGWKSVWISVSISVKTFFFFGDHLFLGWKSVWISEFSEKFRLNFRIDRVILIQKQWKFGSRSFAVFSLFQKSPPFLKSWLRAWFRICVLRTPHHEPYRTTVPFFSLIFKAYRTNVTYSYHYKKGVPYFLAKIEAYRTVLLSLL